MTEEQKAKLRASSIDAVRDGEWASLEAYVDQLVQEERSKREAIYDEMCRNEVVRNTQENDLRAMCEAWRKLDDHSDINPIDYDKRDEHVLAMSTLDMVTARVLGADHE